MIKIIIADDHGVVRRGLKAIIEDERDMVVVAEAASGRETIDAAMRQDWDVIIMDISMPEMNGFEVIDQLRRRKPRIGVLVLSMHPELQFAVRAMEAGAMGYLTKESAPEELVRAVKNVAAGRRYVSEAWPNPWHPASSKRTLVLFTKNSRPWEFRVMCLLASGKSTSQIAQALFLSPKTVETYRLRMMAKMGMHGIAEIARYAFEQHLID